MVTDPIMKVILSRKGFDSGYGGYPSPILPSGEMVSLPIPYQKNDIRYSDVKTGESTCFNLMKDLELTEIKSGGEWLDLHQIWYAACLSKRIFD
jgi:hypothetical protein